MGEKSGGLTNMVIGIVATVALIAFVHSAFPQLTGELTSSLSNIISNAGSKVDVF